MILFCDADCLIQLFTCKGTNLLRWVRIKCGLAIMVVPEVEMELVHNGTHGNKFEADINKATAHGLIEVLDYSRPSAAVKALCSTEGAATAALQSIVKTGREYNYWVDLGEAYSHAACIHLGAPFLSHDKTAVETLERHNKPMALPVLRVFDLMTLAHSVGHATSRDCESMRKRLYHAGEWLPPEYYRQSFTDGARQFKSRLRDARECAGLPPQPSRYDDPLFVTVA